MDNDDDWDQLREEVCAQLETGRDIGETELETMTRLIWQERHNSLMAIDRAVAAALFSRSKPINRDASERNTRVLPWKTPRRAMDPFRKRKP